MPGLKTCSYLSTSTPRSALQEVPVSLVLAAIMIANDSVVMPQSVGQWPELEGTLVLDVAQK